MALSKQSIPNPENHRWRAGRKVGRTIYAVQEPKDTTERDQDPLIGVMDTPELAAEVVRLHNRDYDTRKTP